jgi:hypothetical protein
MRGLDSDDHVPVFRNRVRRLDRVHIFGIALIRLSNHALADDVQQGENPRFGVGDYGPPEFLKGSPAAPPGIDDSGRSRRKRCFIGHE